MSHSRIFMVSQSPIDPDDYITEDICYSDAGEWSFVGSIADWVDGETDREKDIQWLKDVLLCAIGDKVEFNDDEKSFVFKPGFREEYFKQKKQNFLEIVEKMKSGDTDWAFETRLFASSITNVINNKWSFYFYDSGLFYTIDTFIRDAEPNVKFYIGNTIDYHY